MLQKITEKITNAFNTGAAMVVNRNNVPGTVLVDTTGQPAVPAYNCDQAPGDVLADSACAVPTRRHTKTSPTRITGPGVLAAFPIDLGAYGTISSATATVGLLLGDANGDRVVDPADRHLVKSLKG